MTASAVKQRVAVIYNIWPHYRAAVVRAMDRSDRIDYTFLSGGSTFDGIPHMERGQFRDFRLAPMRRLGRFFWQPGAIEAAFARDYDAVIYLGDPNILTTWIAAAVSRLRGVPVLFWAHGWRRPEKTAKRLSRNAFFRLANHLLVYGERARTLGVAAGYPAERITTVYNSLDLEIADTVVERIAAGTLAPIDPRNLFEAPERPLLICTARLIPGCRFDLLIEAAAMLAARGKPVNVLLVGDGPERSTLERLARERGVALHLYGACYDEAVVGQLIHGAELTVSPGKIGLTAMHSLMYGTPAITHDNLDEQMPEVEAIDPDETGLLFAQGDAAALADAIDSWLTQARDRAAIRETARESVRRKWNPHVQAAIIERAVLELVAARMPEVAA